MFDNYTPFSPAPITSTDATTGTLIEEANSNLQPGNPTYTIYVKWAKIVVRSITSGSVYIGGDTTATSPVILKISDVGEREIPVMEGIGIPLTASKGLYYVASGTGLDYTSTLGIHKVINSLG